MRNSFAFLLMFGLAGPFSRLEAQRFAVAGFDDDSVAVSFFRDLRLAVQHDDHAAVAAFIRFPLLVNDRAGHTEVRDAQAFLAQYATIMTPNVRNAVLAQSPDSLFANWQGVMIGRGQIWFRPICARDLPQTCSRTAVTTINRDAPPVR